MSRSGSKSRKDFSFKDAVQLERKRLIKDPADIRQNLNQAAGLCSPCVVWLKDFGTVLKTKISDRSHSLKKIVVDLEENQPRTEGLNQLYALGKDEVYLTIYSKGASILGVKTKLIGKNANSLEFEIPDRIIKIERRSERRFTVPQGYRLEVTIDFEENGIKKTHRFPIFDLSIRSFSFLIDNDQKALFEINKTIDEARVRLRGKEVVLQRITVKNVANLLPSRGALTGRVGVVFDHVEEDQFDILENYLIENLIQYIS